MFNNLLEQIWRKKIVFLGTFFLVFTVSYIVLLALDWLPEAPEENVTELETKVENTVEVQQPDDVVEVSGVSSAITVPEIAKLDKAEVKEESDDAKATTVVKESSDTPSQTQVAYSEPVLPTQIHIAKLNKTIPVINPTSRKIVDLDYALLNGVVRHPDSAALSQEGNMFILGHSSYLPNVFNKNFQAFNGIQNLEWGDMIEVTADGEEYKYRVEKVYRAKAQDVTVPIAGQGNKLTLATCNSFGSIDDRYIVEAIRIN